MQNASLILENDKKCTSLSYHGKIPKVQNLLSLSIAKKKKNFERGIKLKKVTCIIYILKGMGMINCFFFFVLVINF